MKLRIDRGSMRPVAWLGFGALCLALTGATCTEEREVGIVVGADITEVFEARGIINVIDDTETFTLEQDSDLLEDLQDAGVDSIETARVEAAFVRVIKRDTNATDRTVTGSVFVNYGSGEEQALIDDESVAVNDEAAAEWINVPLVGEGVAEINFALASFIQAFNAGLTPNTPFTFHVVGVSSPQGVESNFDWEVRLRLSIVSKKEIEVIDPL